MVRKSTTLVFEGFFEFTTMMLRAAVRFLVIAFAIAAPIADFELVFVVLRLYQMSFFRFRLTPPFAAATARRARAG